MRVESLLVTGGLRSGGSTLAPDVGTRRGGTSQVCTHAGSGRGSGTRAAGGAALEPRTRGPADRGRGETVGLGAAAPEGGRAPGGRVHAGSPRSGAGSRLVLP